MCGVAGIFSFDGNLVDSEISTLADAIKRRGPDKSIIKKSQYHHAAFSRLSIIDLDDRAMQPMISANKRFQVSFNGEIYNRFDLKQHLEKDTEIQFKTSSDTEIFLEYISHFGLNKTLEDAEGMFGFSLHDHSNNELILCVDKFGQKPLYWAFENSKVYYSSDFKSLVNLEKFKKLNINVVSEYLTHGHISAPNTLIQNIKKIEAGTYVKLSPAPKTFRYFEMDKDITFLSNNKQLDELQENFEDTIEQMSDLDVEYACFLSGGVDSSLIAAAIKKLKGSVKTYCVAFPGTKYDESQYASSVAKYIGSKHKSIELPKEKMIEIIKEYPNYFAEPMVDFASIPLIYASSQIDEKVAFVGDGGDELYGGYHDYFNARRNLWKKKSLNILKSLEFTKHFLPHKFKGVLMREISKTQNDQEFMNYFHYNEGLHNEKITKSQYSSHVEFNEMYENYTWQEALTLYSYKNKLQNQFLPKLDRSSMGNGKELRAPFLNLGHIKFKFQNFGIDFNQRKLQRDLLSLYIDPSITNRPKKGFSIPFEVWLKNDIFNWAKEVIEETEISDNIIEKKYLADRLNFHKLTTFDDSSFLWKAVNFLNWIRLYNIKE